MPTFYASIHGTRYYGTTPQEVVTKLRGLVPRTKTRKVSANWPDPWAEKPRVQAEWAAAKRRSTPLQPPPNNDYNDVPFLNLLGLPNTMKGMRIKRVAKRSLPTPMPPSPSTTRHVEIKEKKKGKTKKAKAASRIIVSKAKGGALL